MSTTTDTRPTETLPENDEGVKVSDAVERAALLLRISGNRPASERTELDARAFAQMARSLTQGDAGDGVEFWVETLPAYGESGKGSLRYTRERARLLVGIAGANACMAELAYTGYAYPNARTKRRNYFVNVWGAPGDVERVRVIFETLQARVIRDGYAINMPATLPPAEQTKVRRAFFRAFGDGIADVLETITAQAVEHARANKRVQARRDAAEAAQVKHHLAVGDRETTESTTAE